MLSVSPEDAAEAIVRAAYHMPNETVITIDVGEWPAQTVQALFDKIIALLPAHKMSLRGVRTDTGSFSKLGINQDTLNSGVYKGVPVVMTHAADFDTLEFVFRPKK
jgi:hypothetical protein